MSRGFMLYHASIIDSCLASLLPSSPSATQLLANISGLLINTDFTLDYARPQPPTFVNVGGIQITEKPGGLQLPQSIKDFIESAQDGVILFTMGFIFNAKAVPSTTISKLMSVFSRLPQRVIIKLRSDYWSQAAPANVMVVPWVPQQAVL